MQGILHRAAVLAAIFSVAMHGGSTHAQTHPENVPPGEVYIAPTFASAPVNLNRAVRAGHFEALELGEMAAGDKAKLEIQSENRAFPDITALIMEEGSVGPYLAGQRVRASGAQRRNTPFRFEFTADVPGRYVLVVDNRYSLMVTKQVRGQVVFEQSLPEAEMQGLNRAFTALLKQVHETFEVPQFALRVQPCGMVNAFSRFATGEITMCSEMISRTIRTPGALLGITYHELGHSLLALWGLPGNDNEDTADEFAVQMTLRNPLEAQVLEQFAAFFESSDSWIEARHVIENGGRHSLGVQRSRNIRAAVANAQAVTAKWNRFMYPRMTTAHLRKLAAAPGQYESPELARRIIAEREQLATASKVGKQ